MRSKFKSPFMQTDRSQKASGLQKSKDSPKCLFVLLPESFAFCLPLRHPIEWDSPKFYPLTVVLQGSYRYSVFEKYVCIIAEKTQYDKTFFEICRIFPPVYRTKQSGNGAEDRADLTGFKSPIIIISGIAGGSAQTELPDGRQFASLSVNLFSPFSGQGK